VRRIPERRVHLLRGTPSPKDIAFLSKVLPDRSLRGLYRKPPRVDTVAVAAIVVAGVGFADAEWVGFPNVEP